MYICIYVYRYICIYVCMYVFVYVCVYVHTVIHTYIHTYAHAHKEVKCEACKHLQCGLVHLVCCHSPERKPPCPRRSRNVLPVTVMFCIVIPAASFKLPTGQNSINHYGRGPCLPPCQKFMVHDWVPKSSGIPFAVHHFQECHFSSLGSWSSSSSRSNSISTATVIVVSSRRSEEVLSVSVC